MATFNVDQMKADFEPVTIQFRGQEYTLGADALGLLEACDLHGTIEDKDGVDYLRAFFGILPQLLTSLCPTVKLDEAPLNTGEQFALMKVCTEVLARVGRLTFQEETAADNA